MKNLVRVMNVKRIEILNRILASQRTLSIAHDMNMSRAGLQRHIDILIFEGLVIKQGSGRNTRYIATSISMKFLQYLESLSEVLQCQKEYIASKSLIKQLADPNLHSIPNQDNILRNLKNDHIIQRATLDVFLDDGIEV